MDIWTVDKLILFILFVIPGFISLKVYDLLLPSETRTSGQAIIQAIVYSCTNYAIFSWVLFLGTKTLFVNVVLVLLVLLVSPIALAYLFYRLRVSKHLKKQFLHPIPKPWDYIFNKKEAYWIIVQLQDGSRVGGTYDINSFASSYPESEQIYLETEWILDEMRFVRPIERSKGILISGENIKTIQFFR